MSQRAPSRSYNGLKRRKRTAAWSNATAAVPEARVESEAIESEAINASKRTDQSVSKYPALSSDNTVDPSQQKALSKRDIKKTTERDRMLPAMRVAYWGNKHADDDAHKRERAKTPKLKSTKMDRNIDLMAARLMGMSRMSRQQIENILIAGEALMKEKI